MPKKTINNSLLNFIDKVNTHWIILTAAMLIGITVLSLSLAKELPSVPGTDKLHHFISYAILVFPTALRRPQHWVKLAIFFILYSGLIEIIQPYVNRYGEWLDMLANGTGVVIGIAIAWLLNQIASKYRH